MRVLFQGDSITDAGRDRSDIPNLGGRLSLYYRGYAKEKIPPKSTGEFINLGISGNRAIDLLNRCQTDFIEINPISSQS